MPQQFKNDVERWRSNLAAERDAMALYRALARVDKDRARAEIWRELAAVEDRHAARWIEKLRAAGETVRDDWRPGWRPRTLGLLARVLGPAAVLPIVTALEGGDAEMYVGQPDAHDLVREEEHLQRVVAAIADGKAPETIAPDVAPPRPPDRRDPAAGPLPSPDSGRPGLESPNPRLGTPDGLAAASARAVADGAGRPSAENIGGLERWHRGTGARSGALRAAVFGVNDGLVSNLSLIMGVAGANPGNQYVLLSGVAGLLAGSFSMAAGEYISMQSQRELFERQIALERDELEEDPEQEERELALIYQAKGVPRADAERVAGSLMRDTEVALDTLIREELGLNPDELGSPLGAAASSFASFALGALIPVVPYLFVAGFNAFLLSIVLSAVALFAVGAGVSLLTGRGLLFSGVRMLLIGAAAAAVTYLVGSLIGVSIGG